MAVALNPTARYQDVKGRARLVTRLLLPSGPRVATRDKLEDNVAAGVQVERGPGSRRPELILF